MSVHRTLPALLGAMMAAAGPTLASPVSLRGEDAFALASKLAADGAYADAEAILRTLAGGDPAVVDMRAIDRLAAKIAFAQDDHDRALNLLRGLAATAPEDWRLHYDLAHVAMAAKRDRLAQRSLRHVLSLQPDPVVVRKVRGDLKALADRRTLSWSLRASAAPSTNINTATSAETFNFAGIVPFALDDNARARSGIGMNWSMGGQYTPILGGNWRGVASIQGRLTDHSQTTFDRLDANIQLGVRHQGGQNGRPRNVTVAATYGRQEFGGVPYAEAVGGRISLRSILSDRAAIGVGVSVENVRHDLRPDRDGVVRRVEVDGQYRATSRLIFGGSLGVAREGAKAPSEANTHTALGLSLRIAAPLGLRLGVSPTVYWRNFDAASFVYGEKREDVTADIAVSMGHRRIVFQGFTPSFVYRYTDNHSTVELFRYDRHAMDISFARAF